MTTAVPAGAMTGDEFLAWAAGRPGRHELERGRVRAMSPERVRHNRLKLAVTVALREAVTAAGAPCEVFADGMALRIDAATVREPDASVRCGPRLDPDAIELDRPVVLVEVTSPSSGAADTSDKLAEYFSLPSVVHYLVVLADQRRIVHHRRDGGRITTTLNAAGTIRLDPPGIALDVADVFAETA